MLPRVRVVGVSAVCGFALLGGAAYAATPAGAPGGLTEPVGTMSSTQTATLTFSADGMLGPIAVLTQGAANLDFNFASGGTCTVGVVYSVGETCTVEYTFTPTHPGTRYGGISLATSAGALLANTSIFGSGTGPQVIFSPGTVNMLGSNFVSPGAMAVDGNGDVYILDDGSVVKEVVAVGGRIPANPTIRVLATAAAGVSFGGIAVDGSGDVDFGYGSGAGSGLIKEMVAVGGTVPDNPAINTIDTGLGNSALFTSLAIDASGDLFACGGGHNVYEILAVDGIIPPNPTVKTLASSFSQAISLAVDRAGNLYVADFSNTAVGNTAIQEMVAASNYATVENLGSGFYGLLAVAVDMAGNVYVVQSNTFAVEEILAVNGGMPLTNPTIETLPQLYADFDSDGNDIALYDSRNDIAVDGSGNVYFSGLDVSYSGYMKFLDELDRSDPASLTFAATPVGTTSSDSPQTVTLINDGNAGLAFSPPVTATANPSITPGFTFTSSCPVLQQGTGAAFAVAPGDSCSYAVSYAPTKMAQNSGDLIPADNNLNVAGAIQVIPLNNGLAAMHFDVTAPATAMVDTAISFIVTALDVNNNPATNYSGTVTFSSTDGAAVLPANSSLTNGTGSFSAMLNTVGSQTITATDTVTSSITGTSGTIAVSGEGQTIAFPPLASPAYAGTSVMLNATASSGSPVSYTVLSGPATVSGSVLTYTGAGTVVVEAEQVGNGSVQAAPPVQQTVQATVLSEPVGTASGAVKTVVTFSAGGVLGPIAVLTQGVANLDFNFVAGGSCAAGSTYAAGDSCTAEFTFTPTHPGIRYGGITLETSAGALLANSYIYGIGTGSQVIWSPGTQSSLGSGFSFPACMAVDASGNVFVADASNNAVKEIVAAGGYVTIDTLGSGFANPLGVAVDGVGNLFVADAGNNAVKEIVAAGGYRTVSTLVSDPNKLAPDCLAVDGNGNVFFTDPGSSSVKEITSASGYTAVNMLPTPAGAFEQPSGIALDGSGNVFVSDTDSNTVKEIASAGGYTTVSTLGGGFGSPDGVSVDAAGNVFVADGGNHAVKEIPPGCVTSGCVLTLSVSGLLHPYGVAVDGSGNLFVADSSSNQVVKLDYADPPSLSFAATAVDSTSSDSPQSVTLTNDGNEGLDFHTPLAAATNPSITPGFTFTSSCPVLSENINVVLEVAPGDSCSYAVSYAPLAADQVSGKLVVTDDALNAAGAMQTVLLNVKGTLAATTTVLSVTPANSTYGATETLSATVTPAAGSTGLPTGTVSFYDNGMLLNTEALMAGTGSATASLAVSTLAVGSHTIACTYSGDASFSPSSCNLVTVSIAAVAQDFSITADPPSITIETEHHGSMTLLLSSTGGFSGPVTLTCGTPLPEYLTCELPGSAVALGANATVPVTLTLDTDAVLDFMSESRPGGPGSRGLERIVLAGLLPLALFGLSRRRGLRGVMLLVVLAIMATAMTACSSKYPGHTAPGVYTVPVIATGMATGSATPATHTLNVTLTVTAE